MRRTWVIAGLIFSICAGATAYQQTRHWVDFHYVGNRLKVDLTQPDALIQTKSLAKLPRDLLKIPVARDVLTEDLAFYYEQNEDRLGINGAIKRIAYEHSLAWSDRMLISVFNEPAEVAFWRDGRGALRHYALVMRRNFFAKTLQELAKVALDDAQLKRAGDIEIDGEKLSVFALELHPRRTLIFIGKDDKLLVLSDPGLLFDEKNQVVPESKTAITDWLKNDAALARSFALESLETNAPDSAVINKAKVNHSLVINASTMALGYGKFMPALKGLRFDFSDRWTSALRIDHKKLPDTGISDVNLWRAAPANPSICMNLTIDWRAVESVIKNAEHAASFPQGTDLTALDGSAMVCWYSESNLYAPVFIAHLTKEIPNRQLAMGALASWTFQAGDVELVRDTPSKQSKTNSEGMIWRSKFAEGAPNPSGLLPAIAAKDRFLVFSPDADLVEKTLSTLSRTHPSVADQIGQPANMIALIMPRHLAAMAERDIMLALRAPNDANLLLAAQNHLPARFKALASYPAYRIDAAQGKKAHSEWQTLDWRSVEGLK